MKHKRLVVFGATGAQGSSVINAVLSNSELRKLYQVYGVSRKPDSEAALALKKRDVEILQDTRKLSNLKTDLNDLGTLKRAVQGAHTVFAVTNFWEKASKDVEVQQGKNIADACKESGAYLIWSSLPNVSKDSKGKVTSVHHFDSKAEVEEYIRGLNIPAAFVMAGWYMENQPKALFQLDSETNKYIFSLPCPPDTLLPVLDCSTDFGKFVTPILLEADRLCHERVLAATEYLSLEELVSIYNENKAKSWREAIYRVKGATSLGSQLHDPRPDGGLFLATGYFGGASLEPSLALVRELLRSWREFVKDVDHPAWKHLP